MRAYKRAFRTIAALTLLSVIAATSSTLAWIQTRRMSSISFSEATVRADTANLSVEFKHSFNDMQSERTSLTTLKLETETKVTDISGNGLKLYKPIWSGSLNTIENDGDGKSEYKVSQINDITPRLPGTNGVSDPGLNADNYFVDFTLEVSKTAGSTTDLYVFLGAETKLFHISGDNSQIDITSALRMAVISYDDSDFDTGESELLFIHAPEVEPNATYLILGSGAYGSATHSFANNVELISAPFTTHNEYATAILAEYPPIADLTSGSGNTAVDVTFRVWVEGTDKDAIAPIVSQEFGLNLDLYALSA